MKTIFKDFGIMIDCSRNSVPSVETLKRFIPLVAGMGYNSLQLYTEDTFEVEGHPYIGHQRGRYSIEDLKELDAFAEKHGVEMIPCTQALAHLNAVLTWPKYAELRDYADILLIGEEKTYALLDDMFRTLRHCFKSRRIHIGMDEAHMVGLGKYLDLHGYQNRFEILSNHLKRVIEIAKKYDFEPMMWSDMFFRLLSHGQYTWDGKPISEDIKKLVPKEVDLVYWEYFDRKKASYQKMFRGHKEFGNNIWFAGGAWCWSGLAPSNAFGIATMRASIAACKDEGIDRYFATLWGDDSGECSIFSMLPSLFYAASLNRGVTKMADIKAQFEEYIGIPFDKFMLVDLKETFLPPTNRGKFWLFNDPFAGLLDTTVDEKAIRTKYKSAARSLSRLCDHPEYGYLFSCMKAYAEAITAKADLGVRTRKAYGEGDREALKDLIDDYKKAEKKIRNFHEAFYKMWMIERHPSGFDIQDLRIGGLLQRMASCRRRITDYLEGRVGEIPELCEPMLDYWDRPEEEWRSPAGLNSWDSITSRNIMSHLFFG